MTTLRLLLSDRTGLLGTSAVLLAGLPPATVLGYLIARLLIPVLLIVLVVHRATPTQKIGLLRACLLGAEVGTEVGTEVNPGGRRRPCR